MHRTIKTVGKVLTIVTALGAIGAQGAHASSAHKHTHTHGEKSAVYKGYFEDSDVKPRLLSDWEGDWQSVYPYLLDGTLDNVMA